MSTRGTTPNKSTIFLALGLLLVGIIIGVIIRDFPFLTLKREVDFGMLATVIGLFITVYIMPFIIERRLANTSNINGIVIQDLDAILSDVEHLKSLYSELSPTRIVTEQQFRVIVSTFKSASAALLALDQQTSKRGRLANLKSEVYDIAYCGAKDACTEGLVFKRRIDEQSLIAAHNSLNQLAASIRKYRYETYS